MGEQSQKNKNSPEKCQKVPTCAKLECIASEIRENGGKFSSSRMLDDTKDCLQALKDLRKFSMLPAK